MYYLPLVISIDTIYNTILPALARRYRGDGERVSISLAQTKVIHSNAIPVFAGVLDKLRDKSGKAVHLDLACNARLLYFLESVDFLNCLKKLGIIEYDSMQVGGFSDLGLRYNKAHKIHSYFPYAKYEGLSEREKQQIRDKKAAELRTVIRYEYLAPVRSKLEMYDDEYDTIAIVIAELIVNAHIHSGSMCYDYFQTGIRLDGDRKQTLISVADVGKGFIESIGKKAETDEYGDSERAKFYDHVGRLDIPREKYKNYIGIMEALYFSQLMRERREVNLHALKEMLPGLNANLRIFHANTQVVFTAERCRACESRDILACLRCLYKDTVAGEPQRTPIKTYPSSLAGVHIDVEFTQRGNGNVRDSQ